MNFREFLAWQWQDYSARHRNDVNLIIHIFAVPLFIWGNILLVLGIFELSLVNILFGILFALVALLLQYKGHAREAIPPVRFRNGKDFILRVYAEQFWTFPRFVITGGWVRNLSKH
jgi:hypothetical protein